ncbi:MAG: zinc ribbon domain-containing protein [Microcystis sp. M048S1]|jgi:hypothetical protein|uniref:Zinc-ribbon domain-containing protein n=2 Tax=Microcystis TaxID=1125 RepID=B0JMH5_MICAN|nr:MULTISPECIES: zinc ribbon domain-containing protein [Microcystis]MCA6549784.1 zinc ribbon domain-containing protein [Pseudanabaena sp. M152S2SP2A07QC]MCA6554504.1 zinc ribbon domain-containing protein [Pseudanabaena sp. M135S2SP2A07QC]MCA2784341.1 zinc ribbon domain-containing protein [Microcystis sp. M125S2]MCA2894655.1 zinc ribbon domain-containing protein [Microcystis sp. M048S1]MCA2898039.1 zinc ribbon domain-containing protein [Microcystis sp. M039S1]
MFCTRCGTQNSDNAKFCINCGSQLHSQPVEPEIVQPKREASPNGSKIIPEKDLLKILCYVAIGADTIVLLFGISIGNFWGVGWTFLMLWSILIVCESLSKNNLDQAKNAALFGIGLNGFFVLSNIFMLTVGGSISFMLGILELIAAGCLGYVFYKLNQVKS